MSNFIVGWLIAHQQLFEGLAVGALVSNPGICAQLAFAGLIKIPGVGGYIGKNPEKAKAWADGFDKKIDECIDKYAKDHVAAAPPPSA